MTHDPSYVELAVYLFGTFAGWFGLAAAYYLARIRQPPATWKPIVTLAAAGVALLVLSTNLLVFEDPEVMLAMRLVAFVLLFATEISAFARATSFAELAADTKRFVAHRPHFSRQRR